MQKEIIGVVCPDGTIVNEECIIIGIDLAKQEDQTVRYRRDGDGKLIIEGVNNRIKGEL